MFFFFKQKTAYEMRISDWSSDVCSSDLKFTDRAKGFLQSAQTVAIRMSHQRIGPEHLLKALLEDQQGMASGLIKAAGGDAGVALRETDAALAKEIGRASCRERVCQYV